MLASRKVKFDHTGKDNFILMKRDF